MTYRYHMNLQYGTDKTVTKDSVIAEYGSLDALQSDIWIQTVYLIGDKIEEVFLEKGITVKVIDVDDVNVEIVEVFGGMIKAKTVISCTIETESDFFESPIGIIIITIIGLVILSVVAAFVYPAYFWDWLKSMTTKQWAVEKYEWVQNPNTGEWEWKLVKRESGSEPSTGIQIIWAVALFFILMLVFYWFMGKPAGYKKRRKRKK